MHKCISLFFPLTLCNNTIYLEHVSFTYHAGIELITKCMNVKILHAKSENVNQFKLNAIILTVKLNVSVKARAMSANRVGKFRSDSSQKIINPIVLPINPAIQSELKITIFEMKFIFRLE